jgi:hypothetical protein
LADPDVPDLEPILRALVAHDVQFVLIGAMAAIARKVPVVSYDVDITPAKSAENLERLARALRELRATLRTGEPGGVPFPIDPRALSNSDIWTLTTPHGSLDISFFPSGTQGYDDLKRDAGPVEVYDGLVVQVASLADVIRSKQAANRPKDIAALPLLRQTLEEIRKLEGRD